jgi:hypothetical protein
VDRLQPRLCQRYNLRERKQCRAAGEQVVAGGGNRARPKTCGRSAIVDISAELIDLNVNQNAWISSMLLYKTRPVRPRLGSHALVLDNKASFQRGINQAIRRTTTELVDNLGRVRGTSQVDSDLQDARGNMQFDEYTWYFGSDPVRPQDADPEATIARRSRA